MTFSVGLIIMGRRYTYYLSGWVAEISGLFVFQSFHLWNIIHIANKNGLEFFEN